MSIYKNKKIIVLFLAPVTIGLLVFVYYPLIQTIIGSLYKWVSYSPDRKWVGIANYLAIFQKKEQYLTNYLYIENSTPQDFLDAMEKYFPAEPLMKVYSADSKK